MPKKLSDAEKHRRQQEKEQNAIRLIRAKENERQRIKREKQLQREAEAKQKRQALAHKKSFEPAPLLGRRGDTPIPSFVLKILEDRLKQQLMNEQPSIQPPLVQAQPPLVQAQLPLVQSPMILSQLKI